jgi:Cu/Ag efflux protein CusF
MDHACGFGRRRILADRLGRFGWTLVVWALGLALAGPAGAAATFEAQGRVTAVDRARSVVTLEHDAIPDLLPGTRSEFPVASGALLERARPGDRVRFTLAAADESHGLLTVTSLAPEGSAGRGWRDSLLVIVALILALLALAGTAVAIAYVWRSLEALHRRLTALDHEIGMLRGDVIDTQDVVRQIARALEDAAATFRVGYVRDLRRRLTMPSPAATAADAGGSSASTDGSLVVVQRGRGELYRAVQNGAVGPGCTAIWDRRRGERRAGGRRPVNLERRREERRAAPPETWTRLGFHLVPGAHAEPSRGQRPLRSAGGERTAAH